MQRSRTRCIAAAMTAHAIPRPRHAGHRPASPQPPWRAALPMPIPPSSLGL